MIESILAVDFISSLPATSDEQLAAYTSLAILGSVYAPFFWAISFFGTKYYSTIVSLTIKMIVLFTFAAYAGELLALLLVIIAFSSHFLAKLFFVGNFREYQMNKIKKIISEQLNYDNIMENYKKNGDSKSPEEFHKFAVNLISGNMAEYYHYYLQPLSHYPFYSETLYYRENYDLREWFKKIIKESEKGEVTKLIPSPEILDFFMDQANLLKQRIETEKELNKIQDIDEIEEAISSLCHEEIKLESDISIKSVVEISK